MGYFPSDIPFMSEEELKDNGIKIPKDTKDKRFPIDVYIYKLDLNVEKPVLEKIPAKFVRDGGYTPVIYSVGPNDYHVWHDDFDYEMLGFVYEPLDNVVELIVKRDKKESESITMIEDYCGKKAEILRKKINRYYRGISAAIRFMVFKITEVKTIRPGGTLCGTRATQIIIDDFDPPEIPPVGVDQAIPESEFDFAITNSTFAGPFEGEEDI